MFKVRRGAHIDHDELVTGPASSSTLTAWMILKSCNGRILHSLVPEEEIIKKDIQFALGISIQWARPRTARNCDHHY